MSRKAKEIIDSVIEANDTLNSSEVLQKEELKEEEKISHLVKIEACHSDLFNAPIMFQNTRIIFKILKNRSGFYKMPCSDNIKEFEKRYPSLAYKFIKDNKWNVEEIEKFQVVVTNSGKTLDITKDYDRFEYELLKMYPEVGETKKPIDRKQRFYIINTEEKAIDLNNKFQIKKQCYTIFDKLSIEDKLYLNSYLGKPTINISNQVLDSNILEYIESKPSEFLELNKKIDIVKDYGLVGLLMERGIISKADGGLYYNEIRLGTDIKEVVTYINKANNYDLKLRLKEKISL